MQKNKRKLADGDLHMCVHQQRNYYYSTFTDQELAYGGTTMNTKHHFEVRTFFGLKSQYRKFSTVTMLLGNYRLVSKSSLS